MTTKTSPWKAKIYVAQTACCGLRIHDPREPGTPAHAGKDGRTGYEDCKVLRYFEFTAKRQIARAEILKKEK